MKTALLLGVIVVLVALLGATQYTGFMTASSAPKTTEMAKESAVAYTADEDPSTPERDITILGVKGDFEPHTLVVKKGDTVKVTLRVKDIDPKFDSHGFAIKEFGVNQKFKVGEDTVVSFVADTEGSFPFYCSVFCGEGHIGQAGVLTVK